MGRKCSYPKCDNRPRRTSVFSFHKLPFDDPERLKLWLLALRINPRTSKRTLRRRLIQICSDHFAPEDLIHHKVSTTLRPTAIPFPAAAPSPVSAADLGASVQTAGPDTSMGSVQISVDAADPRFLPFTSPPTASQGSSPDHATNRDTKQRTWIVHESKLLELFKICTRCKAFLQELHITPCDSKIKIKWSCHNGHIGTWQTC